MLLLCFLGVQGQSRSARDSLKLSDSSKLKSIAPTSADLSKQVSPAVSKANGMVQQAGQSAKMAADEASNATKTIRDQLSRVKKPAVTYNLDLTAGAQLNPIPPSPLVIANPHIAGLFGVSGMVTAFGIPLNINYALGHAVSPAMPGMNSNLFNFNFNPRQFATMFRSDFQQYVDLRRNFLGGKDLASYTQQLARNKMSALTGSASTPQTQALSTYIANPQHMNDLLLLNEDQIRQRLTSVAMTRANANGLPTNLNKSALASQITTPTGKLNSDSINNQRLNGFIGSYTTDPAQAEQMRYFSQDQIKEKLKVYLQSNHSAKDTGSFTMPSDSVLNKRSSEIMVAARTNSLSKLHYPQTETQSFDQLKNNGVNHTGDPRTDRAIDSIATSVTNLKQQLTQSGYDVNKLVGMENYVHTGGAGMNMEAISALNAAKPKNGLQSVFSHFQELKTGAYGQSVPGSVQSQDMFLNGTHLTYNTGFVPITVGYGSVNDVSALKDANYQNSVYNQPRSMTYIGSQFNGIGGPVKISVISSVNHNQSTSTYQVPSISPDNVAVTMSKQLRFGSVGNVDLDISKSATLYQNSYQPGAEAILDHKGGLSNDLSTTLFQAMSFGLNHHLDMPEFGGSDNLYFSYAGMGYQNPGNNGFGGAKMKYGGNVRKSFYKNKLTFTLRSDFTNTPISYTSNDRWARHMIALNTRYVFSKKLNFTLEYSNSGTDKMQANIATPMYSFQKLQIDGSSNFKIGKYFSAAHLTLGAQSFGNTELAAGAGNMLMMNYTQSIVLSTNTVTANVFYTKELSTYQLIGNMLNCDLSYQYTLFKKFSLSSGLTSLRNDKVVNQLGVKQGVQLLSSGSFSLSTYMDIRKNLIKPEYQDLYPSCMGEVSIKYNIRD